MIYLKLYSVQVDLRFLPFTNMYLFFELNPGLPCCLHQFLDIVADLLILNI